MARPVALPLTVTVLLHLAVVVLLASNLTFCSTPKVAAPQPKIIEARLVSMQQQVPTRAQAKPEPQPLSEPKQPEPKAPEPKQPEPVKPEPAPAKPVKDNRPDLEKQKAAEKAKAEQRKLAEQKRKTAEEAQRKAEAERKAEEQRKASEEAARKLRQQEKSELAKAMAAEANAMAAQRDREAVASYAGLIQRDIQNNWSRPPSARVGMHVQLLIQLIPSGDVINVSVLKSSGNDAFDRSAIDAVRRVGKFPYLKQLSDKSPAVFENNFRHLQLDFTPEDLRQ